MDPSPPNHAQRYRVLLAFACVYLFWGGTYTAGRIGVASVPAPILAGTRLCVAGSLMLLFAGTKGKRLLSSPFEMRRLFFLGFLLLFAGNVGLVWAEYYLPSGLSALLAAIVPVYVALIELFLPQGERLHIGGQIGIVMGFAGLGILAWPSAHTGLHGDRHQILAVGVLLAGALAFSWGSVWARRTKFSLDLFVCAGWEMVFAGLCDMTVATCLRQWSQANWGRNSILAVSYLIFFGSLIGFSSFYWLLQNVPVTKVVTNTYVNPVVAVFLGAWVLGERLQGSEWIGMLVILLAVFLVTSSKMQYGHGAPETEVMPTESPTRV